MSRRVHFRVAADLAAAGFRAKAGQMRREDRQALAARVLARVGEDTLLAAAALAFAADGDGDALLRATLSAMVPEPPMRADTHG